ncbi:hypothetical protein [Nocardia otitidiscaviarum]|uniref:hypothetical protein n=1 Tax=Nocardia otitidiscaviarum TaxID=1823 RepID=UPI0004A6FE20|nr:hypothetical protein [Nocardia otitidiscaviarum]
MSSPEFDRARGELNDVEQDAVRDSYALLRAALDGDERGARVIAENAAPVETLASLAVLTVTIARFAQFDLDNFIDWGVDRINGIEDAA